MGKTPQRYLEKIREAIARLPQLTSLDLSGNKLTTLPEAIAPLQHRH